MRKILLVLLLLVILEGRWTSGFRAAVFEHAQQSYGMTSKVPKDIVQANLDYYKRAVDLARSKGVDIIVFPEYGIIPDLDDRESLKPFLENVPDPKATSVNPCLEPMVYIDRPILYTLSCLARSSSMIIVANMGDVQPCEGEKSCPKDGVFHFNTNVVFDRDGSILMKYHKEHLFNEPGMNVPVGQQDPTFETHLGRFATFVCFDIIFQRITEVAHWKGVKAVLLPTMWVDNSPLFTSILYHQAWAIGNNVTLLTANVQLPGMSGIGSGIMRGRRGAFGYTFNPDGNSKLVIADLTDSRTDVHESYVVGKDGYKVWTEDGKDVGHDCSTQVLKPAENIYKDYRCLEVDTSTYTLTKLSNASDRVTSCNNGMCCTLEYSADEMKEDFYLGVYNGTFNALNLYFWAEENCFFARCDGMGGKDCVTFPTRSETTFYDVRMEANFSTEFVFPSVLESGMRLTPASQWNYDSNPESTSVTFKNSSGKKLLGVGLKGRAYERDPPYA